MASIPSIVLQVILLCLAYSTASFVVKLYHMRSRFQRMQKEGLVSCFTNRIIALLPSTASSSSPQSFGRECLKTDIMINPANAPTSSDLWTSPCSRTNHV